MTPVVLAGRSPTPELQRSNLTHAQFLMWLGQQLDPGVPLYNMIQTFRIDGAIDPDAFARAWASVVDGSDALRTRIEMDGNVPTCRIVDRAGSELEVVDLRDCEDAERAADEWIRDRKVRPIAADEQLWDSALLIVNDDAAIWYLCVHHLVTDGRSFAVMFQEMKCRYELACTGSLDQAPELHQYADYVEHERSCRASEQWTRSMEYWHSRLQEPTEDTEFYGATVSHRSTRTDRISVDAGDARSARLRDIARRPEFASVSDELSLNAIWATVLFTTIHRVTGRSSIRIGTPFQARRTSAFRDTIGLFIEIGVLDVEFGEDETFASLAGQVLRRTIKGLRHARPGISSAELNRSYDILLNYVTSRFDDFGGHPVSTDWVHTGHGDRDHALRLQVSDFDGSGAFRLHFDLNADLFGAVERRWFLEQFDRVLEAFVADPLAAVGGFPLLDDDQQRELSRFNETDEPCPDATVVELFDVCAAAKADAVAVRHADRSKTYAELAAASNRVAEQLIEAGVKRGDLVAIHATRSIEAVTAIFGVLRAGAAYVPIDPTYPDDRRRFMVDDAGPAAIVIAASDEDDVGHLGRPVVVVDADVTTDAQIDRSGGSDELAYVIYTSGSTGTPKGTELTHGGLTNYVTWAARNYTPDVPRDFALYSSLAFDLTITSVFVPLVSGGAVVVYDRPGERDGLEILDVLADDRVDIVKLTPAHLELLIEARTGSQRLSALIVGGENFRTDVAVGAQALFPGVTIFNEYGPTEAVVGCMVHRFDPATDTGRSVPIGAPIANARIHVLDRYDRPVPPGVVGEMVVSGAGVARGYRNRPELTNARFGNDAFRRGARWYRTGDLARWGRDGRLQFLGRNDAQVKIRGARIEPDEIEAVARSHPEVDAAVVDVVAFGEAATGPVEHCSTCGLPSNYPGSGLDATGECSDCRAFSIHRDDVNRYFKTAHELDVALAAVRARACERPYDCLILVSGGKDSTYMLYQLVREFGMRPLVFTLDNGFISESALANVREACADLGVDLHVASTPHMNAIFADSLQRHANVCDGCYKTIYTLSMGLAREHGIEAIVTGLSRGQLFETRLADSFAAREFDPDRIDAWIMDARKAYHHIDDAVFRLLDNDLFVDDRVFEDISFIDYYRFVDVGLDELYRYLNSETVWTRPADTGRSTNCLINDVGIYVHTRQRGYHNYALPYSWDVRIGHKQREAAMEELDDEIDVDRVREILDEVGCGQLFEDLRTDKRLVVYYTASESVSVAELRRYLAERLPDYMVPTYLVRLAELPLTVNGKVDRAALPDPRDVRQSETHYRAPQSESERRLVTIWRDALQVPTVGVDDNFFDLGGDSITSIQIVAATKRLGWSITARDVFAHQTISELARVIDASPPVDDNDGDAVVEAVDDAPDAFDIGAEDLVRVRSHLEPIGGLDAIEDVYPLTPTQLGMVYQTLRTSSSTYVGQGACKLHGDVDGTRLQHAWATVIARHPSARVRFIWSGLDTPVQVVLRDAELRWQELDWRDREATRCDADLEALLSRQRDEGFDLASGVLMNFTHVRTDGADHLVWNCHHAVLDGWSAHLLFREALEVYEELATKTSTTHTDVRPFRDHVRWLAERDRSAALAYWGSHLSGIDTATELPFAADTDLAGHASATIDVDEQLHHRIKAFSRSQRVTLSALMSGAWALLLSRLERTHDVLFGATVSGREGGLPGVDDMIGMFLATLPVRVHVDAEATVGDWLRGIQRTALDARDHGHLSLAELQRLTEIPSGQPLFDSIVVIENYPTAAPPAGGSITAVGFEIGAPSDYALSFLVHPGDSLRLEAVFDRSRIDAVSVDRLLGLLEQALRSVTADAAKTVGSLAVITDAERRDLLAWSTGPSAPAPNLHVHASIAQQATARPDAVAVHDDDRSVTYAELIRHSNGVASELRDLGVRSGDRVCLITDGGADQIVGMLGILLAGGVYVPVDPSLPTARMDAILDQAAAKIVLTGNATGGEARALATPTIAVSSIEPVEEPPDVEVAGSDFAYVIFTSGSTGTPKGVAVTHDNIAHSTSVREQVYDEAPDSFLLLSSLAFDSSMVGVFWTLCNGGTLVVPGDERRRHVNHVLELIERHRITHLLALPSLYALLLDEHRSGQLDSLRTVIVAGETCPVSLVERHRVLPGAVSLVNEYGPTEGTVWSHSCRIDGFAGDTVPIGRPIPNSIGIVVDGCDDLSPIGIPGELVLGGAGVAAGYLDRPELTEQAFVRFPHIGDPEQRWYRTGDLVRWTSQGDLEFVGRLDSQIKIRGHRVELGEIDAALVEHPDVRLAATIVLEGDAPEPRRRRLVGCYESNQPVDEVAWRRELLSRLPDYMVPSEFVELNPLPRTSTGKIDRESAVRLARDRSTPTSAGAREPASDLERALVSIWADVLDRDDIGVDDDFFDLGGNSLDAMRLFARIEQTTGREMQLATLFQAPTIARFAALIRSDPKLPTNSSLVAIKPTGFKRPFFYVPPYEVSVLELGKIARHFDPDRPFLGLQPLGLLAGDPTHETIAEMADHYIDAIRSYQPHGPYLLGGHCDGAWVAHEMAIQLADRGEAVAHLALTDLPPVHHALPVELRTRRVVDRLRYYARDGRLLHAIWWQLKLRFEKQLLFRFGSDASRRVRRVRIAHEKAFDRYVFRHDHRAPVHLIRSTELAVVMNDIEWYDGLDRGDGSLLVTDIASTHARLLREPETIELADALRRGLDAVDDSG